MKSEFHPPIAAHDHGKTSTFIAVGSVSAALMCFILILVGIAWKRGYIIGNQISRKRDLRELDLNIGVFTYRSGHGRIQINLERAVLEPFTRDDSRYSTP